MKRTLINVEESTRASLDRIRGDVSPDAFLSMVFRAFDSGDLGFEDGKIIVKGAKQENVEPLIAEFKAACDSVATDWEYGMKKAITAIRGRRI